MKTVTTKAFEAKRAGICIAIAGLSISIAPSAQAISLTAGSSVMTTGTTVAAEPQLAGLVLEDRVLNIGSDGLTLQDRVSRSSVDNTLDFSWRLINPTNSAITVNLSQAIRSAFADVTTNVDWRTDGLGSEAPFSASRSADGNTVAFDFSSPFTLAAGDSTRFFFIDTDATNYDSNGIGSLTGVQSDSFATFQPTAAVPTPALLPGLIGFGASILRKRKQSEGLA